VIAVAFIAGFVCGIGFLFILALVSD